MGFAAGRNDGAGRQRNPRNNPLATQKDTQLVRLSPLADKLTAHKRDAGEAAITCFLNNCFVKLNLIRYKDFK